MWLRGKAVKVEEERGEKGRTGGGRKGAEENDME